MNEQQRKTLRVRVHVKRDIALENMLTMLATDSLFQDVSAEELITTIVDLIAIDNDTRLDMLSYLESERETYK